MATQVLGEMFAMDKAGGDLVKKYPTTWNVWISRKSDKAVSIRVKLVESCRNLIVSRPEVRESLKGASSLTTTLCDIRLTDHRCFLQRC
jgi:sister-chromatid-cohesion protein PDS5